MKLAEHQAIKLLHLQGITQAPVDVFSIAEVMEVEIVLRQLDPGVSGILVIREGKAVIGVNQSDHINRKRFTVAHELGHLILHKPRSGVFVDSSYTYYRDRNSSDGSTLEEIQANAFAAELLMPQQLLVDYLYQNEIDLHDDVALSIAADHFEVSKAALVIRLVSLGIVTS